MVVSELIAGGGMEIIIIISREVVDRAGSCKCQLKKNILNTYTNPRAGSKQRRNKHHEQSITHYTKGQKSRLVNMLCVIIAKQLEKIGLLKCSVQKVNVYN